MASSPGTEPQPWRERVEQLGALLRAELFLTNPLHWDAWRAAAVAHYYLFAMGADPTGASVPNLLDDLGVVADDHSRDKSSLNSPQRLRSHMRSLFIAVVAESDGADPLVPIDEILTSRDLGSGLAGCRRLANQLHEVGVFTDFEVNAFARAVKRREVAMKNGF
ncbi:hypothetical protein [Rathayibacter sp. AY1C6]|uniref:hypothetical protein n=1 Tax=Rathayibacter sp. AY1C6 TaxID=2080539 RepID=UPI0011B09021|nr:hypothetical protein [Rathayibacter sp. AY1C6]